MKIKEEHLINFVLMYILLLALICGVLWLVDPPECPIVQIYAGPQLPPDDIAIVKTSYHWCLFGASVDTNILKADERNVPQHVCGIEVLPGEHKLDCYVTAGIPTMVWSDEAPQAFSLWIEAGHVYEVDANCRLLGFGDHQMWIVDEQTGNIVAGSSSH